MKHNLDALRAEYTEYLDAMFDKYNFGSVLGQGLEPDGAYYDWEKSEDMESEYDVCFATGATRFVLIGPNLDYVVKFQDPTDEYDDYGEAEVNIYNAAVVAGFGEKFAWCSKLMEYQWKEFIIPIYVYEYAQCSPATISDDSYDYHYNNFCASKGYDPKSREARSQWWREGGECSTSAGLVEYAVSVWQFCNELAEEFVAFLNRNKVNDLHSGNWGYIEGNLVLIDYAGFGEEDDRTPIRCNFR